MIVRSIALTRRLVHEMERHAGSLASIVFYDGVLPASCDETADGKRIESHELPAGFMSNALYGTEPRLPEGATYWRVYDNGGIVVMQGDGR